MSEKTIIGLLQNGTPVMGIDDDSGYVKNCFILMFQNAPNNQISVNLIPLCSPMISEKKIKIEGMDDTLANLMPVDIKKETFMTIFEDIYALERGAQFEQLYNGLTNRKGIIRADIHDIEALSAEKDVAKLVKFPK